METFLSKKEMLKLSKFPERAIKWIGSVQSLRIHTILFIVSFLLSFFKLVAFDQMLLVLTTIVSLEAIYLSIFIQMSVNMSNEYIEIISEDVDEISENIDEIMEEEEEDDEEEIKESEVLNKLEEAIISLQKDIVALKKSKKKKTK
jgi:low affinity Fe/Cu permease